MLERRRLLAVAPVPAGPEFRVNSTTAGSQVFFSEAAYAVAGDADGDFVVTWSSSGQDGNSWGVYAQQYDAAGAARGGEFRVNQSTANSQWYPTVASDADGDFVVTWTSYLQDGSQSGVYARRYGADGLPRGGEFRVNSTTAGDQRHSSVTAEADGDFVVTWMGNGQSGGSGWDVYAQRYAADGTRRGGEFRVNATTSGDQQYASVAVDADGDFVVAWTADGNDGSGTAIVARRYNAAGVAQGGEFRVNTFTDGHQAYGRVSAAPDGRFVVAWASAAQDGGGRGVYAQRYDAAGRKQGGELAVNQTTAGEQFAPTVAVDSAGTFFVTWTTAAQDGDAFGIYGRAYNATGAALGGEFRVNSTAAANQVYSCVAAGGADRFVVAWQSDRQDGSSFGIYGQRFAPPVAVVPAAVVGRHLFYNGSTYDGNSVDPGAADDGAIDPGKHAVLGAAPAAALSMAAYSGYTGGINGIMIDLARPTANGAAGAAPVLSNLDFAFVAGNGGSADAWATAPAPLSVTVRPGAGVSGSDRVTLVWANGAVSNQWLRLTVKANNRTGLASPDVFYFGNLVGETGNAAGRADVDAADVALTRLAFSADPVPMSSPYDHNRDGRVDSADLLAVRKNVSRPPLQPVSLPASAAPPAPDEDDSQRPARVAAEVL